MLRKLSAAVLTIGGVSFATLFFCLPHTERDGLSIRPEAGYAWRSAGFWPAGVAWSPGKAHPQVANIVADAEPDDWAPLPGYDWIDAGRPDACSGARRFEDRGQKAGVFVTCNRLPVAAAHWAAGRRDDRFPHVETTTQEGVWEIDAGYRPTSPGGLQVAWTANVRRQDRPHLVSGPTEGEWRAAPGYVTRTSFFSTYEAWAPGTAHPTWPNVVADGEEGLWRAASGYELSRAADGTLGATAVRTRALGFVIGAGVALAGQGLSQSREDDGLITREFLRPSAREVRDAGLRGMGEALRR